MTLSGKHFLQRFCLHILPKRFRRIRHYGFLSNASKSKRLNQARKALFNRSILAMSKAQRKAEAVRRVFGAKANLCPCCKEGQMYIVDIIAPNKDPPIKQIAILGDLLCECLIAAIGGLLILCPRTKFQAVLNGFG